MIHEISTVLDDYDSNKISFEIGGKQYDDSKKWEKSIDDRLFRYQLSSNLPQ
ncbi:MAG: hypothetical protein ICV56_01515 [Nitrososphaeraceae archaeon]|nr:hypothetical protein [Nitrososphaeraceae archaeon]